MESENIRRLKEQIRTEEKKILNCQHQFDKAFYNPRTEKEPYGYKLIGQGSDVWSEPEGYRDLVKPMWTRICHNCGFEEHTDKQKLIVSGHEPDFN